MELKNQKDFITAIRKPQISDAFPISKLIINCINFFHSRHYTDEELAIWQRGYSPSKVKEQLLNRQSIVLEVANEICGLIQFEFPELKGFYIHPKFIGQGFGGILLQEMLSTLKIKGSKQVELSCNKWVVDFYKKYGFELIGEEVVYWENHPFIEYRMIKKLTDE